MRLSAASLWQVASEECRSWAPTIRVCLIISFSCKKEGSRHGDLAISFPTVILTPVWEWPGLININTQPSPMYFRGLFLHLSWHFPLPTHQGVRSMASFYCQISPRNIFQKLFRYEVRDANLLYSI